MQSETNFNLNLNSTKFNQPNLQITDFAKLFVKKSENLIQDLFIIYINI